ncbi:MAG: AEC family transporter [Arcicella sp.]|nr:AEC family transporter [Arcicella sp.]
MTNLILLFVCLLLGIILQRIKGFPKDAHLVLNAIIIHVCLPALTLLYTTEIHFERSQILPILMPYILFGFAFVFFKIIAPIAQFDRSTTGALTLTAGISSISFVGFPIFELLFGKEGLQMGIMMSQAGSFVVCGTLGIFTVSYYSASEVSTKKIIIDIFQFPPFVAFCIAVILNVLDFHFSEIPADILQKIGSPFTVLALISIGLQISFKKENLQVKPLLYGLLYKLLLAPSLIFILYLLILGEDTFLGKISVVGAALGSMNTATIIAINYGLNPKLATQMVSISIPLSFLNVAIWYWIIN